MYIVVTRVCPFVRPSVWSVRVNIYHGNSIYIIWSRHNIIWSDWACITFLNFQFAIWGQSRVEKMTFSEAVVSFEPFSKIQANSIQEYDFACFVNAELGFGIFVLPLRVNYSFQQMANVIWIRIVPWTLIS